MTLPRTARIVIGAQSLGLLALLAYTTLSRIGFPYELEWLEGWTVQSVRRVLEGRSLFVKPSVEWVPYTYTPLYTYTSAAVAGVIGHGFLAPRIVSLLATAGCLAFTFALVRHETKSRACGLAAAGFVAGTYPLSGAWFDVGRVDNLFLFFLAAAFYLVRAGPTTARLALAGLAMALAYMSKQTALLPLAALSLYGVSELKGWNRVVLPGVAGALIGGATLLLTRLTDGWYFFYTFTVQSLHGLGQLQLLAGFWTGDLGWTVVPAAVLGLLYLGWEFRKDERPSAFVFYGTLTVAMVGAAWISRLHGGGWLNVLQPAHAVLALLFGLGLSTIAALGGRLGRPAAALYAVAVLQLALLAYDPRRHIPTAQDVADGDAFVAGLRRIEGEVYTPMHGHLGTLAGKREFAHDGYLLTVLQSLHAPVIGALVADFQRAFATRRFAAVVIDYEDYRFMDLLREHYRYAADLPGSFRPRRGPKSVPQKLYLRRDAGGDAAGPPPNRLSSSSPEISAPLARPSRTRANADSPLTATEVVSAADPVK
jgi:hypothetical protein